VENYIICFFSCQLKKLTGGKMNKGETLVAISALETLENC
jgi:hypothetical protein